MEPVYTETELVTALKNNCPIAFEYLYDTYSPALYGYLLQVGKDKSVAEKILVNTFVSLKSHFKEPEALNGKLFTFMIKLLHKEFKNTLTPYLFYNPAVRVAV